MVLTFGQLLSGIPKPPTVQEILSFFGTDDMGQRGHAKACLNAAAPLKDLLTADVSIHRPYENLKQSLWTKADMRNDETRHLIEQIILFLDKTWSKDSDKIAILAMIMSKIDDLPFLEAQLEQIKLRTSKRSISGISSG